MTKVSTGLLVALLAVAAVPCLSDAASAVVLFGPLVGVFSGAMSLFYYLAAAGVVYLSFRAIMEVANRREQGDWVWYAVGALGSAIFAFAIVPVVIAPGLALGVTPDGVSTAMEMIAW